MAKRSNTSPAMQLCINKMESSGLTEDDARALGIEFLEPSSTASLHGSFMAMASLKFNYFDLQSRPLSDVPGGGPYYRLRYLPAPGFDAAAKMDRKYVQEPRTAPVAYYPKLSDWNVLTTDISETIIITEGELKAAKACKEGFPTIGLGGVDSWKSRRHGWDLLPSLKMFTWTRRSVIICFDSDYLTNANVCRALQHLSEALEQIGAFVKIATLPAGPDGKKMGIDDFFVAEGRSAAGQFEQILIEAEPIGFSKVLWAMNERYCCVQDPAMIVNTNDNAKFSPTTFRDYIEAPAVYSEPALTATGEITRRPVSAAGSWIKWPLRNEVTGLTYAPGEPRYLEKPRRYNTWPGWGLDPEEGDVDLFLQLIDHIFQGAEPEAKDWFIRWCAYPLQYPGIKLFSSVVVHGIKHGTGKSLLGFTLGEIYGRNFGEISGSDLHNSFNEWADHKQMVMGDDVTGGDKRADADRLKKLITQKELSINKKYIPMFTVPDCVNYYFTANHPDAFFLEDDDRRFFIHEVECDPLGEDFYVEYDMWRAAGGAAHVFHYLLNIELGDFNPSAPAFKTQARSRMIENIRSDLASWVRTLQLMPDHVLRLGEIALDKDLFTTKELLVLYDPVGKTGTTAGGLGREMSRAGFRQACGGRPIRTVDGMQARYYAVRNSAKWNSALQAEAADYINQWNLKQQPAASKF